MITPDVSHLMDIQVRGLAQQGIRVARLKGERDGLLEKLRVLDEETDDVDLQRRLSKANGDLQLALQILYDCTGMAGMLKED